MGRIVSRQEQSWPKSALGLSLSLLKQSLKQSFGFMQGTAKLDMAE
jgi:hypothetical protein